MSTAEPPDDPGHPAEPDPADSPPTDAVPVVDAPPPGDATPPAADAAPPVDTTPTVPVDPPPADPPTAPVGAAPLDTTPPGPTWSAATTGVVPAATVMAPAPDTWLAPAPAPKRKLTWLWILLGVLVLIAALVVVAVVLFIRTLSGPIDATNAVLAQIKAENYAAAYRLSCASDRELYTEDQYAQVFENSKAAEGSLVSYDVNYSSVDGDEAEVRYDLEFSGGTKDRYESTARKENGKWRACLFPDDD